MAPPSAVRRASSQLSSVVPDGSPEPTKATPTPTISSAKGSQREQVARRKRKASTTSSKTPSVQASRTPAAASRQPSTAAVDRSSPADEDVFCICRRPDDHKWMIACDGGCNDWFHGACVNVKEKDGPMMDKYVCPNCTTSDLYTLWKRKCRLPQCDLPARVGADQPQWSRYCSDEHGTEYMRFVAGLPSTGHSRGYQGRRAGPGAESAPMIGGALTSDQLAAIARHVTTAADFKRLGHGPVGVIGTTSAADDELPYTTDERARMAHHASARACIKAQLAKLAEVENLVHKAHERARSQGTGLCGYDPNLSSQFEQAVNSSTGGDEPVMPQTSDGTANLCQRKRCEQHRSWRELLLRTINFEQASARAEMHGMDQEDRDIRLRAATRQGMTNVAPVTMTATMDPGQSGGMVEAVDLAM
ncbi:MAG: hypothetical protein M1823_004563 [Watsoniomyces obsoletus]|nr:MAG: hypothetical protein M1823_004563 [Watsoniomyces obsoletus]